MTSTTSVCVILLFGFLILPSKGYVVKITDKKQNELHRRNQLECFDYLTNDFQHNISGPYCNRTWDGVMCWPDVRAGVTAYQPCPTYINLFETEENTSRTCLPNGTWYDHPEMKTDNDGWTNYNRCGTQWTNHEIPGVPKLMVIHLAKFQMMYNVGYTLSLVSLLIAVGIIAFFRKLHCPRNAIHLNLFASFIFRAGMSLLKDNLMVEGLGFPDDIGYDENQKIFFKEEDEAPHWKCRLFFTISFYCLAASYIWIFVEALYLHMLIFVAIFTEKTRVVWYMLLGWGLPLVFLVAWAIAKYKADNNWCWNLAKNTDLIWIIQTPIYVTIVINFFFFINIVRVLFTKLNSSPCPEAKKYRYRRLARSTLVLIPIFGVYYILFTYPMEYLDDTVDFAMLVIEMFFNSYQGFFISVVLCFVNAEVRAEIKKAWLRGTLRRNSATSRTSHASYHASRFSRSEKPNSRQNKTSCCGLTVSKPANQTILSEMGDNEESIPLASVGKSYSMNGNAPRTSTVSADFSPAGSNANATSAGNKKPTSDDNCKNIDVKINFVNIECDSGDGTSSTVTSVDIEKYADGVKTTETIALNNNRKYRSPQSGSENVSQNSMHFMDESEEDR